MDLIKNNLLIHFNLKNLMGTWCRKRTHGWADMSMRLNVITADELCCLRVAHECMEITAADDKTGEPLKWNPDS